MDTLSYIFWPALVLIAYAIFVWKMPAPPPGTVDDTDEGPEL